MNLSDNDMIVKTPAEKLTEKLLALSKASDEMMKSILLGDRQATLRTVVRHVYDILEAESCGIFLVPEDSPKELVLEANYSDKWGHNFKPVRIKIQSVPKGGLTGHIAHKGRIVSLNYAKLKNNRYVAEKPPEHLKSGEYFSSLGIPLNDRKGHLLGLLKVDNKKKSANENPSKDISFTKEDEFIARVLANKIVVVLENLRMSQILREIMHDINTARTLDEILDAILQKGLALIYADRGDFVLWSEVKHDLIIASQFGKSKLKKGQIIPSPTIIRTVWSNQNQNYLLIKNVSSEPNYAEFNPQTKSEIAIRLEFEGRPIGVFNAESFQLDNFDEQDLEVLQLLAQYAIIAYQAVGKEMRFRGIVQRLLRTYPTLDEILISILESLRNIYWHWLDGGIIYIADYMKRELRCSAFISEKKLNIDDTAKFSYSFDEVALATEVFHKEEAFFSANPFTDRIVNKRGLKAFQIKGSMVGVPLIFREKVIGVLVVWGHRIQVTIKQCISELESFAQIAAFNIVERQRTEILKEIQKILTQMQKELSLKETLRLILHGIQVAGFDRVRIYKFEESMQSFVGLDSLNMNGPEDFQGYTISVNRDPYSKFILETARANPEARKYEYTMFGPDPNAEALGKLPELPWAVVPLVITGKVYGYIAVDNAQTGRDITNDNIEYLTLLGTLAAQAIANTEKLEMELERTMAELARRTIHGLKNPAMATQIFLEELTNKLQTLQPTPTEVLDLTEKIRGQVDRISALAEGMRRSTRPLELRRQTVNINELVQRSIHNSLINPDCKAVFDLCEPSPIVAVDIDEIDEAITQLSANAWNAMKNKGELMVKTWISSHAQYPRLSGKPDTQFILISLTDSGPGVPASIRRDIFQAGVSTTGGLGLGLYSVMMIVLEHGGDVWIENTGPNGSTFIIALPMR